MNDRDDRLRQLEQENRDLRADLHEARATLDAIRSGEVDALVVHGANGEQVFSLRGTDHSYRVLLEEMQAGAVTLAPDGSVLFANRYMEQMLQVPLEKVIGRDFDRFVQDADRFYFSSLKAKGGTGTAFGELKLSGQDGTAVPVYLSANRLLLADTPVLCLAVTNLTDQKRHEQVLAQERLSRAIIDQSAEAIVVCDARGIVMRANRSAFDLAGHHFGKRPFDDVFTIGLKTDDRERQESLQPPTAFSIQQVIAGRRFLATGAFLEKEGRPIRHLLLSAVPLVDDARSVIGGIVNLADTTEIVELEEQFRLLFENSLSAVVIVDQDGIITAGNPEAGSMFGWSTEELPGQGYMALLDAGDPRLATALKVRQLQGRVRLAEMAAIHRSGERFPIELDSVILPTQPVRTFMIMRDISHRKRAEKALRESEEKFSKAFFSSPAFIFISELATGTFVEVNDAFCEMTGYTRRELVGKSSLQLGITSEKARTTLVRRLNEVDKLQNYEMEIVTKSRQSRNFVFSIELMLHNGKSCMIGSGIDITERRRAEQAVRASLQEKEVLLKEIHHRVKNNMQVISSLMSLQANESQDATLHGVLDDITHRVRSMAMVHEKLYHSADLARVDFADYARSLLDYLWRAHSTAASSIRLATDMEPISFTTDVAVPCGLILNELVSNALKHAFGGRDCGVITVGLHGGGKNRLTLSVGDDGVGLPEALDWQKTRSMGLRLVQMLTGQLRARVTVSGRKGTCFQIEFDRMRS